MGVPPVPPWGAQFLRPHQDGIEVGVILRYHVWHWGRIIQYYPSEAKTLCKEVPHYWALAQYLGISFLGAA